VTERSETATLILVLEEWVFRHTRSMAKLSDLGYRYNISDFMNVTGVLMTLKGVPSETFSVSKGDIK